MARHYLQTYFLTCAVAILFVCVGHAQGMTEGEQAVCDRLDMAIDLLDFIRHGLGWLLGACCGLAAVHRFFV